MIKKTLLLIHAAFLFALPSCKKSDAKKDGGNGSYYIKFKYDGADKILIAAHGGVSNLAGVTPGAAVYGKFSNDSAKESSILILDSLAINTSKVYKNILITTNGTNAVPQASFTYFDEHNTRYVVTYLGYVIGTPPAQQISIKFTEITSGYLKGTFTAAVEKYGDKQPYTLHQITEGEFYLRRDY